MRDFKQTLTENSYSRQEELIFADCDRNQRARVASLLSKMATFAGYDYDARGLTHDILYANREIFLISRIAMRIHLCPRASDVLTVTTWENGGRGAHMPRVVEMVDQEGRLCVSTYAEYELKKLAVQRSQMAYLLVDSSKFGGAGLMSYGTLADMKQIITDSGCPDGIRQLCAAKDIDLTVLPEPNRKENIHV